MRCMSQQMNKHGPPLQLPSTGKQAHAHSGSAAVDIGTMTPHDGWVLTVCTHSLFKFIDAICMIDWIVTWGCT